MSRANTDLKVLTECGYRFPTEAAVDIQSALATYRDLHPYVDFYYYTNKDKKRLVNLSGTIPVLYQSVMYNIPVCIWLHETHPQNPPKCFVRPSVSMVINSQSSNVDPTGLVLLRSLSTWQPGQSSLAAVIEEMRTEFQRETPLFSAPSSWAEARPPAPNLQIPQQPEYDILQRLCEPHLPYTSIANLPYTITSSNQNVVLSGCNRTVLSPAQISSSKSTPASQDVLPSTSVGPGMKKSYTEELLELGISFGEVSSQTSSPSNPFLQNPAVSHSSSSEEMANLFRSLRLENVVNICQPSPSKAGDPSPVMEALGGGGPVLVDSRQKIEVNRLPQGVSPRRMKNKLTIYFQRRQNGGGEVLDVQYPAAEPDQACVTFVRKRDAERVLHQTDRIFTLSKQHFPIQVKKVDTGLAPVPNRIPPHKTEAYHSLLSLKERWFSPEEVLEAVESCKDLPSALRYLSHVCPICQEQVSFSKIITMTHCSCAFCENCFRKYFSTVIKEKSIVGVVCPICSKPDVREAGRMEEAMDYFNLLDTQIRHYLDKESHELFQRKLRDHALQEMPNFRWCAHCSFGVLHESGRLRMDCPSCCKSTCAQCRSPWAVQHENLSCKKFKEWELDNNPEHQAAHLEILLSRNRIDCPKCHFRFYLSRGGCLHFRCTQCQHEFCGGCGRAFRLGPACDFSADCKSRGLHAHHPRDCLYYLRDWDVCRLQGLLQNHRVSFVLPPPGTSGRRSEASEQTGACPVLEHREAPGLVEELCVRPPLPQYGGYCMVHYKECLVELINRNRLDPAELFDLAEMETELQRWRVPIPASYSQEDKAVYLTRLRQSMMQLSIVGDLLYVDKPVPCTSGSLMPPQSSPARGLYP